MKLASIEQLRLDIITYALPLLLKNIFIKKYNGVLKTLPVFFLKILLNGAHASLFLSRRNQIYCLKLLIQAKTFESYP